MSNSRTVTVKLCPPTSVLGGTSFETNLPLVMKLLVLVALVILIGFSAPVTFFISPKICRCSLKV